VTDLFDGVADLRAHVLGSVFQVANWVFLAGDGSYQDLLARSTGTASPLEHFWSLAIEEQFYWVWPPLMLLVLSRVPRRRGRLVVIGTITAAFAAAAPVIAAVWGADAAYWSTPARIGEILLGAFLAMVLSGRATPARVGPLAPLAAAVLAVCVVTFPSSGGPAYSGALPLVAVVSAALVLGLQGSSGFRRMLEGDALVWVGKVSYGLYVFHWPIFVLVHPDRFGWPGPVLFAARMVLTFGVTILSYELIEQPVRERRRVGVRATFTTAAWTSAAVLAITLSLVPAGIGEYWNPDADVIRAAAIDVVDEPLAALVVSTAPPSSTSTTAPRPTEAAIPPTTVAATRPTTSLPILASATPSEPAPSTTEPLPELTRPVRIVVAGDSTAKAFGTGLVTWAAARPELAQVEIVGAPGCGFLVGGERRTGDSIEAIEGCDGWVDTFLYPEVEELRPDLVVAMVTSWDLVDRRWSGEALLTPFDTEYADRLDADYAALATGLLGRGAGGVVFLRHPIPNPYWLPTVDGQEDPARHAVVYDLYERLAAADERVHVLGLDRWMAEEGLDDSDVVRPDGIHPVPDAATGIAERYLGEELVRVALAGAVP
jgi:peptidoglycan/LPS O-acetylase OafA/YrhL